MVLLYSLSMKLKVNNCISLKLGLLLILSFNALGIFSAEVKRQKKVNAQAFHLCELAVQVASEKNYETAIIYLKRALEIEPKFATALFNLGSIYRAKHKYNDAYFAYQQLLQINPADHEARLEKVLTLISLKDFLNAEKELEKSPKTEKRYNFVSEQLQKAQKTKEPDEPKKDQQIPPILKASKGLYSANSLNFNTPTGIASDNNENIYIANFSTNVIEKVSKAGERQIIIQGDLISGPSDIIYDAQKKSLLIANYKSGNITSLDLESKKAKILINNLQKPYALFLKSDRKLYISEQGRQAVSIIDISNY